MNSKFNCITDNFDRTQSGIYVADKWSRFGLEDCRIKLNPEYHSLEKSSYLVPRMALLFVVTKHLVESPFLIVHLAP